jgi:hypothetical protein
MPTLKHEVFPRIALHYTMQQKAPLRYLAIRLPSSSPCQTFCVAESSRSVVMKTTCAAITLDANLLCCSEDSHLSPHFPKLPEVTGSDVHDHHLLSYPFRQLDMLVLYTKQQTLNSSPVFIEVTGLLYW